MLGGCLVGSLVFVSLSLQEKDNRCIIGIIREEKRKRKRKRKSKWYDMNNKV